MQPTLLVDVTPDMEIAKEEVFGPIMTVMKFTTDANALEMVNSCAYGLGSNVFSLNKVCCWDWERACVRKMLF